MPPPAWPAPTKGALVHTGTLQNPHIDQLVAELQQRSLGQIPQIGEYFADRAARGVAADPDNLDADADTFLADKLITLEHDKALFCHRLCLAIRARQVVEVGTSYGVSTLYLAQALHLVTAQDGSAGRVIGTEIEPAKAAAARAHFRRAGLDRLIELREVISARRWPSWRHRSTSRSSISGRYWPGRPWK